MLKIKHAQRMTSVYSHIYADFYELKEDALAQAKTIIQKNLRESGIDLSSFKGMNVLNVGPTREAVALHALGAKNIYHFDISDVAVESILKIKSQNRDFDNLYTRQTDICINQDLGISEKIDFVYLSGVLHHLYDPRRALENIFRNLSCRPKLFFRIYRSGSLAFFVVDFIRKFIGWSDKDRVVKLFRDKYGSNKTGEIMILYADMYDNFFVPTLRLYIPKAVNRFFGAYGLGVSVRQNFVDYDHANTAVYGQGWSLYYSCADFKYNDRIKASFPGHLDQLQGIDYKEDYIKETVNLMKEFLVRANAVARETKIAMALELYRASQLYRSRVSVCAAEKHKEIQQIILRAL